MTNAMSEDLLDAPTIQRHIEQRLLATQPERPSPPRPRTRRSHPVHSVSEEMIEDAPAIQRLIRARRAQTILLEALRDSPNGVDAQLNIAIPREELEFVRALGRRLGWNHRKLVMTALRALEAMIDDMPEVP